MAFGKSKPHDFLEGEFRTNQDRADKPGKVGGNLPAEHRFRKGVSGNPKGRPPRKVGPLVSTPFNGKPAVGFEDRIKSIAIKEAYRLISVREGNRVERIPLVQAIVRKVGLAAASGKVREQQIFLNLLIGAETDRRIAATQLFGTAVQYKEYWHEVLETRERTGATGPEPVPHPDDVVINGRTGEVTFSGPVMREQKAAEDALHRMRPDLERRLVDLAKQIKSNPRDPSLLEELLEEQAKLTEIVEAIYADALKRNLRKAKIAREDLDEEGAAEVQ